MIVSPLGYSTSFGNRAAIQQKVGAKVGVANINSILFSGETWKPWNPWNRAVFEYMNPSPIEKKAPVFSDLKRFLPESLEVVPEGEKVFLRKVIDKTFTNHPYNRTVRKDMGNFVNIAKNIKHYLSETYPDDCCIFGLGRSPEAISGVLEHVGQPVSVIPFSKDSFLLPAAKSDKRFEIVYKRQSKSGVICEDLTKEEALKYLEFFGLTKEIVNSGKNILFIDFMTQAGRTVECFKRFLRFSEIGIKTPVFQNIYSEKMSNAARVKMDSGFDYMEWLLSHRVKQYARYSSTKNTCFNFVKDPEEFVKQPQSLLSKLFYFALYEGVPKGGRQ